MSRVYNPPSSLLSIGRPLDADELGKTFLRFPGPCGFQQLAHDGLLQLAPQQNPYVYLFENRYPSADLGIKTFCSLAVFEPQRLQPVRLLDTQVLRDLGFQEDQKQILLGLNESVTTQDYFWIPPELHFAIEDWRDFTTAASILKVFGNNYHSRLLTLKRNVLQYMEEVDLLNGHGINLTQPWYTYSNAERTRLLQQKTISSFWTTET